MKVPIEDIIVNKRIRKDLGDISALAESFKIYGQITPIIINKKNVLIAGGRRLEAAKLLGWQSINAVIIDRSSELEQLEIEFEENKYRKDFNDAEAAEAARKIYKLKHPSFFRRVLNAIVSFFKKLFRIKD
ncbi:MAG: ParB N-terminal domain-containing protein [Treponema sp.]|jgi:ParB family chromosome partitioning protein|nr:ParB N-terminal domain-containing protein [Treponema sp.]